MAVVVSRESVFQAVFGLLVNIPGFTTYSRRMIQPGQVEIGELPTLRLWEGNQHVTYVNPFGGNTKGANYLPVDEWDAAVVIYFQNDDPKAPGGPIINPLVDSVRNALVPNNLTTGGNDLGLGVQGLWCRVEGIVQVVTGDTNPTGVGGAVIPLKIKVPTG